MKIRAWVLLGVCCATAGCSGEVAAPDVASPANGLMISVVVPGQCLVGGCDPANSEATTLALETLANTSDATVFLAMCGGTPAITEEQLVRGTWQFVGSPILCASGPRSQPLAAHDSIRLNAFYAPGTFRLKIRVALDSQLSTEATSVSAPFTVH